MTTEAQARLRVALERAQSMKAFAEGEGGFFELMALLEDEWIDQWRETPVDDVAKRETIYAHVKVLGELRRTMAAIIVQGKVSEDELERLRRIETGEERPFH